MLELVAAGFSLRKPYLKFNYLTQLKSCGYRYFSDKYDFCTATKGPLLPPFLTIT